MIHVIQIYISKYSHEDISCLEVQREKLLVAGVTPDLIFSDSLRKKTDTRSSLRNCLKTMRPQSTLIILTLDRLGDRPLDVIELGDFFLRREAGLNVLSGIGSDLDLTSNSGRKALEVWALLSDFQKRCHSDKILSGLAESRARGITGGPKVKECLSF